MPISLHPLMVESIMALAMSPVCAPAPIMGQGGRWASQGRDVAFLCRCRKTNIEETGGWLVEAAGKEDDLPGEIRRRRSSFGPNRLALPPAPKMPSARYANTRN